MNKEDIQELMDYNLEYMEAQQSEEIFGGDYTSAVDLKYANKQIETYKSRNEKSRRKMQQSLMEQIETYKLRNEKAIEYIKNKARNNCWIDQYESCELIKILRGKDNE